MIPVPAARQRVLLAALLVQPGRVVSFDELGEVVWDGVPPPGARATLRNYIKRLRQVLGPEAGRRIVTRDPGYLIEADEDEVDLVRFAALCAEGGKLVRARSWRAVSDVLGPATALWRGTALADIRSEVLKAREVPRLEQLRLQAVEWRLEADLQLGGHGELIPELRTLVAEHPWREHFHAQLMLALYRSGRQGEALTAYRAAWHALIGDLGVEPGPDLQRLHQRMLAADPSLTSPAAPTTSSVPPHPDPSAPTDASGRPLTGLDGTWTAPRPARVIPRQLPADVRHFTGRADHLSDLDQAAQLTTELPAPASPTAEHPPAGHRAPFTAEHLLAGRPAPFTAEHLLASHAAPSPAEYTLAGHYATRNASAGPGAARHITVGHAGTARAAAGRAAVVVIAAAEGCAGAGASALAVHWAHRVAAGFPDGQLYVNLRGTSPPSRPLSPAAALDGFLTALAVPPAEIPGSLPAQTALFRRLLAGRRVLILLDDACCAAQVRPLLPGSPGTLVVITSRHPMRELTEPGQAAVTRLTVGPLSLAESRELLARRMGARRVAAEPSAAAELASLCRGLPLALNVVAARCASDPGLLLEDAVTALRAAAELSPGRGTEFRAAVEFPPGRGTEPPATAGLPPVPGDPSVHAALTWSAGRLSPSAARLLHLLGLHPGPDISLAAAASLSALTETGTRAAITELIAAHLVAEPVPGRYALPGLPRAWAGEQARVAWDPSQLRAAVRRVLDHYLHSAHSGALTLNPAHDPVTLDQPSPGVRPERPAGRAAALAWFAAERQVLLAAVEQAASEGYDTHAWQLPWALADYFEQRGHWRDWTQTQQTALAATRRLADLARPGRAGHPAGRAHPQPEARPHLTPVRNPAPVRGREPVPGPVPIAGSASVPSPAPVPAQTLVLDPVLARPASTRAWLKPRPLPGPCSRPRAAPG